MGYFEATKNYFYMQQSRVKTDLYTNLSYYRDQQDPDFRFCVSAFHLRYLFMVTTWEVKKPLYPAGQLSEIRKFLNDSYENPYRVISLTAPQIRELLAGIEPYRVSNSDNYAIVMRHLDYPDEMCSSVFDMGHSNERAILESVLSQIPEAIQS